MLDPGFRRGDDKKFIKTVKNTSMKPPPYVSFWVVRHLENLGADYATILKCWRQRLTERLPELRPLKFDNGFFRKWEYYFSYCEAGFSTRAIGNI